MKGKSIKAFFRDLGIMQIFCRPHTPDDNAEMESFFATLKCEMLYRGSYGEGQALQAETDIAVFIEYYNCGRLHQGIGFVTPQERHDGRDKELREERREGLNWPVCCGSSSMVGKAARMEVRISRRVSFTLGGMAA